ncbi:MAG: N-acetyltransferase, partial [Bacteroidetes bacterium]|nr:N-acetyltransferase [Bacteroidota bacterium]
IIDHTEVDPAFGGRGLGQELLMALVNMAREKKIKIIPLCPFANAQFKKQSDIQDVLK